MESIHVNTELANIHLRWIRTKSPGAEFENGLELLSCSADYTLQFHLATDASISGIGGVLFQLVDTPAGAEAGPATRAKERIPMFLSFRLNNAETTYSNPARECSRSRPMFGGRTMDCCRQRICPLLYTLITSR